MQLLILVGGCIWCEFVPGTISVWCFDFEWEPSPYHEEFKQQIFGKGVIVLWSKKHRI